MGAGLKIKLTGFDELLAAVKKASGDVDRAASKAIKESARIYEQELRIAAHNAGVPQDIISQIKSETSEQNDRYSARVGWRLGAYDPANPSAGYKAMFINYGTVRRITRQGWNRGQIAKPTKQRQFITIAKRKANTRIKRLQQDIIKQVQEDLK